MYTLFHEMICFFEKKIMIFKLFVSWIFFPPKMFLKITIDQLQGSLLSTDIYKFKISLWQNDFNECCALFQFFNFSHVRQKKKIQSTFLF